MQSDSSITVTSLGLVQYFKIHIIGKINPIETMKLQLG